ncbi:putative pectinesterase 55 [Vitis vinifera]|uniref:pectinesterase n=1 Tax=Vitis vinifera TaxID=29760 RepID=A0A438IM75_VITVI|nr:putative pectinesterase 55 [Vitis vinifera]
MSSIRIILVFLLFSCGDWMLTEADPASIAKQISIPGDYGKIQDAIDQGVPSFSNQWTLIKLASGVYTETILINGIKSNIILEGGGKDNTILTWKSSGLQLREAPLMLKGANNFIAKGITFKNTLNHEELAHLQDKDNGGAYRAVAAMVHGEHISFYECGFVSVQDTLWDKEGHHLFKSCYIEGHVDFIFGDGTSVYEDCKLNSIGSGYITAQKRESHKQNLVLCSNLQNYMGLVQHILVGHMDLIQGNQLTYAEVECTGEGADTSNRVPWLKKLDGTQELQYLLSPSFNDKDGWIEDQPKFY